MASVTTAAFGLGEPGATTGMRFSIDPWDPSYGSSMSDEGFRESTAKVEAGIEEAPAAWRPVPPPAARGRLVTVPEAVLFVDGVRREEARGWIHDPAPAGTAPTGTEAADYRATSAAAAVCASFASGVVCSCGLGAHLLTARVERGLFTSARHAADVVTAGGTYQVRRVEGDGPDSLNLAIQQAMTALEIVTAAGARHGHPGPASAREQAAGAPAAGSGGPGTLLVVDGPLRGRTHLPRSLGFIKTHHSRYLEAPQHEVVGRLEPGYRTPVFLMGTTWDRYSWYLRLPSRPGAPWAGVARVECPASLPAAEAVALADLSQVTLPRYASHEFKDRRAPQNLYPIAGLERALRRRLGDRQLLYRSLRRAAVS